METITILCRHPDKEELSKSRVYYNVSYAPQYTHPNHERFSRVPTSKLKVMLVVGFNGGTADLIDKNMYPAMTKMYYAKRHGYYFAVGLSNKYSNYFAADLFEV